MGVEDKRVCWCGQTSVAPSAEGDGGRGLKGSTLGPLLQHRCRLLRPFSLALVGVTVNLHPAILNWGRLQGDHAWDAGRGRGRSPPTCLIDLLAHHLLFPLNTRLHHPSNSFFHSLSLLSLFIWYTLSLSFVTYLFIAFINLYIYNVSTYLSTIKFILSLFILSYWTLFFHYRSSSILSIIYHLGIPFILSY